MDEMGTAEEDEGGDGVEADAVGVDIVGRDGVMPANVVADTDTDADGLPLSPPPCLVSSQATDSCRCGAGEPTKKTLDVRGNMEAAVVVKEVVPAGDTVAVAIRCVSRSTTALAPPTDRSPVAFSSASSARFSFSSCSSRATSSSRCEMMLRGFSTPWIESKPTQTADAATQAPQAG